jgi:hemerythrin-like metal-binding protein
MDQTLPSDRNSDSVFRALFESTAKDPDGALPDSVYAVLPHVYVCAGLLTVVLLRNWIAVLSGLAWLSAAGLVWVRRYRYRSPFNRSGGHIDLPTATGGDARGESLIQIFWQRSFECGHSVLDAQHRRLFGLGNELIKAVSANKLLGDIEWLLDELVDHITDHFCTEDAVLSKTKHPISKEHQGVHRTLLSKAADLRDRHRNGQLLASDLVGFIVYDVITDHITREAVQFSSLRPSRHTQ